MTEGRALGKTFAQLQAEQMAERRYTDLMAGAGLGAHRMGQELMYMLPKVFLDVYEELFMRALGGKDDGGVNLRGQAAAESGQLQKGKAAAREGKRYKKYWVVADERALDIKERLDKRLRGIAREIKEELEGRESEGSKRNCRDCGRLLSAGWKFCPYDGSDDEVRDE